MPVHNSTMGNNERVSLRDYVDVRFESIAKEMETGNRVLDARLEKMNEFRAAMTDQSRTFMTRPEYDSHHCQIVAALQELKDEDIKEFRDFMAKQRGAATMNQVYIAYALAVIGMLTGILGHFLK